MNQNYLRQLLRDWGEWVDRSALHTGYPTESSIVSAKERLQTHTALSWQLPGGGSYRYALPSRHAILCYDMPSRLVQVHQAILALTDEDKAVLTLWYAYSLKAIPEPVDTERKSPLRDGKVILWERKDKAVYVGMSYAALQRSVSRARWKLTQAIEKSIANASEKVLERRSIG